MGSNSRFRPQFSRRSRAWLRGSEPIVRFETGDSCKLLRPGRTLASEPIDAGVIGAVLSRWLYNLKPLLARSSQRKEPQDPGKTHLQAHDACLSPVVSPV